MAKQQIEIENVMLLERPVYRSPDTESKQYKPDPVCGCGCGKWSADGFETEHGDYIYSKECYYNLSIQNGWLKEVS